MSDIHLDLLDNVRIASPCAMRWEDMRGDHKTRHCDDCDLNVTNLSAMTREEATAFVASTKGSGRICVGFYRRTDGTILTRDCPRGLAMIRARAQRGAARLVGAVSALASVALLWAGHDTSGRNRDRLAQLQPFQAIIAKFNPPAISAGRMVMGERCIAPTPVPSPSSGGAGE